jgi:hypothetical protein
MGMGMGVRVAANQIDRQKNKTKHKKTKIDEPISTRVVIFHLGV